MATKNRIGSRKPNFAPRDAECPHCGTECEVREGNGVYECSECGETFEVDLREAKHVHQPDGIGFVRA